jgi:hypothetical protein
MAGAIQYLCSVSSLFIAARKLRHSCIPPYAALYAPSCDIPEDLDGLAFMQGMDGRIFIFANMNMRFSAIFDSYSYSRI